MGAIIIIIIIIIIFGTKVKLTSIKHFSDRFQKNLKDKNSKDSQMVNKKSRKILKKCYVSLNFSKGLLRAADIRQTVLNGP